jgi:SRSO17 transposase
VRDDLRTYVLEHLGEEAGVLVVDETGLLKKGKKSAGGAPQYSGTAGGRANCQIGVFLVSAGSKGAAFIDRELDLADEWTQDRVRCGAAGIPHALGFATNGALAQRMLARAFAAGVRAAWVVGDSIYGSDEARTWLQTQRQPAVLAVAATHSVWVAGQAQPVGLVAALLPDEAWARLAAGAGSQGPRRYRWAWLEVDAQPAARGGWRSWILMRRSRSEPSKRADYRVWGPPQTTLADLVRRAGQRWRIEAGLEEAKGAVGLEQYEVRPGTGWYRHITRALLAHAVLVVLRAQAQEEQEHEEQEHEEQEKGAVSSRGSD